MKKAKYILYGILVLIVIALVSAFFLPKEYDFQKSMNVDASNSVVYNLLVNLENRKYWDPIALIPESSFGEGNNHENFEWSSEEDYLQLKVKSKVKGSNVVLEKKIERESLPDRIQYNLIRTKNKETNITIDYQGRSSWPMNLFNFFSKRNQSQKIQDEFINLEIVARKRQNDRLYNGYKIVEEIVKEKNFIIKRDEISALALQQFYVQNLGVLFQKVQEAGLQMDGMPSGLFFTNDIGTKSIDMAAAIPVNEEVYISGAESHHINTRSAVVVDYYGDYNKTILAHTAIKSYLVDNNYEVDIPIVEEYVTDPGVEKDPTKWLTKITYYIVGK